MPFALGDPLINEQRWVYSSLASYRRWFWDIPQPVIAEVQGYAYGAYLAAAQRAQGVIDQYDGAPAERTAVAVLLECYQKLGFTDLAANVQRVYAANYTGNPRNALSSAHHWWVFWRDTG